ncbi:MAG: hypothetical protein JSV80_10220 [Acidobacteriota bacterium]|nr:MAG: hypothetical protein JSV80_10220 [Acidobacteriota bacterium]
MSRPRSPACRRWCCLRGTRERLRLPIEIVDRVETVGVLAPVPRAPRGLVGVAEIRGRAVTVLDPRWLAGSSPLEREPPPAPDVRDSLLTLAPPFEHLALLLPSGWTQHVETEPFAEETVSAAYEAPDGALDANRLIDLVERLSEHACDAWTRVAPARRVDVED